jgi:hypothetical protein
VAETKRRARAEDSICYDRSRNRWAGTITVGWKPDGRRDRIIVRGRTKTEVKDKLRTQAESTVTGYRIMVRYLVELLGSVKLAELKVRDVGFALGKLAKRLSTRSVRLARMILIQAIRNGMVNDLVVRNVADLAAVPQERRDGRLGRSTWSRLLSCWTQLRGNACGGPRPGLDAARAAPHLRFAPVGFWRTAAVALGPLFESRGETDGGQN